MAKRKTIAQQREHVAEQRPQITLVPSEHDAAEQHAKASDEGCGAIASFDGNFVECALGVHHGGDEHDDLQGRRWRRRSGDRIGVPGSEPTA